MQMKGKGYSSSHHRRLEKNAMESEPLNVDERQTTEDNVNAFEKLNNVPAHGKQAKKRKANSIAGSVISYACHVLTAGLTVYLVYLSFKSYSLFSWHPACAAIGFLILMAQSIMVMSPDHILVRSLNREGRIRTHWILMTLAAAFILASFVVIVINKFQRGKQHFKTLHAIVGLVAVILVVLTSSGGIPALYSMRLKAYLRPATLKLGHSILGIVTFVIGVACFITSLYTHFFQREASYSAQIICIITLLLAGILTLVGAMNSVYGRIRTLSRK